MPPAPKAPHARQRRNVSTSAASLAASPVTHVDLPTRYSAWKCTGCALRPGQHTEDNFAKYEIAGHDFEPAEAAWNPMTLRWWDTIWASPMVEEWVDADVPDLMAIAVMVDEFWRTADSKLHAEIRMAQREFGLTPLSRRSLQWEVKRVESVKPAAPARPQTVTQRRSRLGILEGGRSA